MARSETTAVVRTCDLRKTYAGGVEALAGVSLDISPGETLAVLGPNGAGKTTLMRILATLSRATAGTALVGGFDVATQPDSVRRAIGYVAQSTGVDALVSGREQLLLYGRLFRMSTAQTRERSDWLISCLGLGEVIDRLVRTYSGGMKRRLDLAISLLHIPQVLLLDEPTNGLDPGNRHVVWNHIRALTATEGVAVLLTTHYMDEADILASRLAILESGHIVASGTPSELKNTLHGDVLTIEFPIATQVPRAQSLLQSIEGVLTVTTDTTSLSAQVDDADSIAPRALDRLCLSGVSPSRLSISRPSLDDVYLAATGHKYDSRGNVAKATPRERRPA
jgi:ABC-2 type transport system ATP-binding protein